MKTFSVKPQVRFDLHALDSLKDLPCKKFLIVTDPFMAKNHAVEKVVEQLPLHAESYVYTDVQPDPGQELVDRGIEFISNFQPEVVIAFGGGSAIDAAKAIIYLADQAGKCARPLFIAIPTTAGTGSETTNFAVITRGSDKIVLIDDSMYPDIALLDEKFTKTVPPQVTVDTGIDVLTHALEAYVATGANLFTDVLAEKAIALVFRHLPIVFEDGLRMKSRKAMIEASCMAGMAFTNAGLGINHSLAHTVGGSFHVAHGRLNAILLPQVLSFNAEHSEEASRKYAQLAKLLSVGENAKDFIDAYKSLANKLGIQKRLSDLERIDKHAFESKVAEMAEVALRDRCTPANPCICTKQDLVNLLRESL